MATEFERIARLRRVFARAPNPGVLEGIGDDAAVLAPSSHTKVWTVDTAVEGVHFDRAFMTPEQVGYRAFMAAASDVAAMGARAVAALSALVLPGGMDDADFDGLITGLARAAEECACPIVGGNLARGRELSLTTSVLGECRGKPVLRSGAQPGDGIFVTGPIGGAGLGLWALRAGRARERAFSQAASCFLSPRARLDIAEAVAREAHASIDISDGLAQDLLHLCRASGVHARLDMEAIPVLPGFDEAARSVGADPYELILGGGEDYELLFTASDAPTGTRIGRIEAGEPGVSVHAWGRPVQLAKGFDHFR
jgi:thiamine-monophosphate kinase